MDTPNPSMFTRRRSDSFHVRVSEPEKTQIRALASASNMTLSDFGVWCMLYSDQTVFSIDPKEVANIKLEIARQGNNLNQIAHGLNTVLLKSAGSQPQRDLLEDCLGMILRLNEENVLAYREVGRLQSLIHKHSLKRLL